MELQQVNLVETIPGCSLLPPCGHHKQSVRSCLQMKYGSLKGYLK